jgi:hypothetical protein
MTNDEKRCSHLSNCVSGRGGIRWRGLAPTASELSKLTYALRRSCVFDDATHRTGSIEYRGKRVTFEVCDDAVVVAATDQTLDPRHVAHMRPMVALEQERRSAERVVNTEAHKRRFGR